mmetsp:Transcript_50059/g.117661  ORF Transcript_50059/g.117661 Transcript_50059/m.117661 type:complete len:163 (-) Transcript_50059:144-632(-)
MARRIARLEGVVRDLLPDQDPDWVRFIAEEAARAGKLAEGELWSVLEEHLTAVLDDSEARATCDNIERQLVKPASASESPAAGLGRVSTVFSKQIAKRERAAGLPDLTSDQCSCRHEWRGEKGGGPRCQICDFETTNTVWKCRLGCDITLCGSCSHRWKTKM